jgi:hypothetical protein
MELYIQKTKIFDTGTNSASVNNYITDATKSWTTNQYKDYYVYILSGTGAGLIAKITSNNATTLNFSALTISLDSTSVYQIVDFPYYRVEMFQDEKVSVTSTIQNYSDIGKLFTDYSQSFTIPASPTNNAIFSHWYDNAVDNGYDARIRYSAFIEIETIPFKQGNVQLEKANKKNGYVESYTLTFYGNLTQLKDKFGEDKLNSLDFSSLNHTFDFGSVISRIQLTNNPSTGLPYTVRYPLIGNTRKFDYNNATIYDVTTNTGAINWNDLFPAVPITSILDFIEAKYGITFTGNFLNYNQFSKLQMLMKNSELPRAYNAGVFYDQNRFTGTATFPEYNTTTDVITSDWNSVYFRTNPSSPFNVGGNKRIIIKFQTTLASPYLATNYKVELLQDGVVTQTFDNLIGNQTLTLLDVRQLDNPASNQYKIRVSALGAFDFKAQISYIRRNAFGDQTTNSFNFATSGSPTGQSFSAIQNIGAYVPDIKVADFFMGLVKMFNLIITPINETTFKLEPLELYYQAGQIKDLTPFIYADELDIEKPKLFKSIEFTYEKSENILNNAFRGLFNREYGDLTFDSGSISESSKYEIKLPFEDIMWERATGSNFQTATLLNKDLQSYTPKPILMYNNGLTNVSSFPIKIFNGTGYTSINNYIRFNNEINTGATDLSYLYSINFGNEVSSWYLVNSPQGLYRRHYEQYIANLYNQKTRIVKAKAKLPYTLLGQAIPNNPNELVNLKLNDRIIIRDNRYIINSFTTDLTNGEATFELINDYRTLGYDSVGYRFSNIELLNIDNTAQEVQIDLFLGMFKQFQIKSLSGWLSSATVGIKYEDTSMIVTIAANGTASDRSDVVGIVFKDYDNNNFEVEIPITQTA